MLGCLGFSTRQVLQLDLLFFAMPPKARNLDVDFATELHQFCCQGLLSFSTAEKFACVTQSCVIPLNSATLLV
ncbi:hypothetical protein QR77_17585 [Streptomyces sp. 150FB]|nr:hypothetical protein QR77_17585 [Streptomyces sp. 150FB]